MFVGSLDGRKNALPAFRFDQTINGTRVVSNPRGYPDEPVIGFDPSFTIDVR